MHTDVRRTKTSVLMVFGITMKPRGVGNIQLQTCPKALTRLSRFMFMSHSASPARQPSGGVRSWRVSARRSDMGRRMRTQDGGGENNPSCLTLMRCEYVTAPLHGAPRYGTAKAAGDVRTKPPLCRSCPHTRASRRHTRAPADATQEAILNDYETQTTHELLEASWSACECVCGASAS